MAEGVLTASLVEVAPESHPDSAFRDELTTQLQSREPLATQITLITDNFTPCNYAVRCVCDNGIQKKIHNVSTASLAQLGQVKGRRDFLV